MLPRVGSPFSIAAPSPCDGGLRSVNGFEGWSARAVRGVWAHPRVGGRVVGISRLCRRVPRRDVTSSILRPKSRTTPWYSNKTGSRSQQHARISYLIQDAL